MDMSIFHHGKVHFINSGVKKLKKYICAKKIPRLTAQFGGSVTEEDDSHEMLSLNFFET